VVTAGASTRTLVPIKRVIEPEIPITPGQATAGLVTLVLVPEDVVGETE
jgi:hypothetical protein